MKCVLSKMMVTTCLTFPRGELSWQPAAEASAGSAATFVDAPAADRAAAPAGAAHAGAKGENARSTAVPMARAFRSQLAIELASEPSLFSQSLILNLLICNRRSWTSRYSRGVGRAED